MSLHPEDWEPGNAPNNAKTCDLALCSESQVPRAGRVQLTWGHEITPRDQEWLWPGMIPGGALTLLEGPCDVGKTCVLVDAIARMTTGREMPLSGIRQSARTVLILACEDSKSVTWVPRLQAAGADMTRLAFVESVDGDFPQLPRHASYLRNAAASEGATAIVVDPLKAYVTTKDEFKESQVRQAMTPVVRWLEADSIVMLAVRHWRKGAAAAIHRGAGSTAWGDLARQVLCMNFEDPRTRGRRVLAVAKGNLAPDKDKRSLALDIGTRSGQPVVDWQGYSTTTADDLSTGDHGSPQARACPTTARERAEAALSLLLAKGPRAAAEVRQMAKLRIPPIVISRTAHRDHPGGA